MRANIPAWATPPLACPLCNWERDDLGRTEAGEPIWHNHLAQMNAHLIVRHNDWRLIENIRVERKSRNCRTHTDCRGVGILPAVSLLAMRLPGRRPEIGVTVRAFKALMG